MTERVYSVSRINDFIGQMINGSPYLSRIAIRGEVSNCSYTAAGHVFFTLKDEKSELSCVLFASRRAGLLFRLKNGLKVVATGAIEAYEAKGRYQLNVRKVEQEGAGERYARFLKLKQELEEMGMFDAVYKKPIPFYIRRLGVVTAPTGQAIHDIIVNVRRRNPFIQIVLFPALVQGKDAPASIVRGIEMLDEQDLDCIIVGRGGGSIEELWAFNEEAVARSVFDARTPIISAVGHERDVTLTDLAADLRVSTPTAAAVAAALDVWELLGQLEADQKRFSHWMERRIAEYRIRLETCQEKLKHFSPQNKLHEKRLILAEYERRIRMRQEILLMEHKENLKRTGEQLPELMERVLERKKQSLQILIARLDGLSPLKKLKQGYCYAAGEDGRNISSIADVQKEESLRLSVIDGTIQTRVIRTEPLPKVQREERTEAFG